MKHKFKEDIVHNGALLAMIIYDSFSEPGVHFFTAPELSQQIAYMSHPKGRQIDAHIHNRLEHKVYHTQEVLVIKKGVLRVDFYDDQYCYLESRILEKGDVILLISGGHGFEVQEDVEMIEIKQGPYRGDVDKTRFPTVSKRKIRF